MKQILLAATLVITSLQSAWATPLSIEDALRQALEHNPELAATRQEINKALGTLVAARGLSTPSLTLSGQASEGNTDTTRDGRRSDSLSASLTLSQNLYSGGATTARQKGARAGAEQAAALVNEAEEKLTLELYRQFYGVIVARQQLLTVKEALKTTELLKRQTQLHIETGLADRLESIRVEHQLKNDEANVIDARTALSSAEIALGTLLGSSQPMQDLAGSFDCQAPTGDVETSWQKAQSLRGNLKALQALETMQRHQVTVEQSAMKPQLDLQGQFFLENPWQSEDKTDDRWRTSLILSVPLYDRNQTRGAVIRSQAQLHQAESNVTDAQLQLRAFIENAWLEFHSSETRLKARTEALNLASEALRLAQVGYREGLTPQIDLLKAQNDLTAAQTALIQARYDRLMKIASLKQAEGQLIPWTLEGVTTR